MTERVVIFVNGELQYPEQLRQELRSSDCIICADGGADHALTLGLKPHTVIGDLDSIGPAALKQLESSDTKIIRHPIDKDQTDLELAIDCALEKKPKTLLLVSALGGRLDHLLGNCLLLAHHNLSGVNAEIFDGHTRAQLLRGPCDIEINAQTGDTLSLLAIDQSIQGLNLVGTKWTLKDAELKLGSCLGMSNIVTSRSASISFSSGMLYAITSARI